MSLTNNQVNQIKEHLERAQNPVFLFDNDQDGMCSFLLLQRFIGKGKGFPVKNARSSGHDSLRKIQEFDSDYIFILDIPEFSKEFLEEVEKFNLPIVWIDHHGVSREVIPDFVFYYNPFFNSESSSEPVTYLCWQIVNRPGNEDLWLAVVGCIADKFVPDFYDEFRKKYPELVPSKGDLGAFDILYNSEIGKIAMIFGFGLKDKTTNVMNMMKFLMKARGPHDVLVESEDNKSFHRRFMEIGKKYSALMDKAKRNVSKDNRVVFFRYAGDTSMSADIGNELSYLFPDKYIFVAYTKGSRVNISVRGENVRDVVLNIIECLEGATGGGHQNAVGAQIDKGDLESFERNVKKTLK